MADTATFSVKDARFSLSTKETFYQMKADQKALMTESKAHEFSSAYNTAFDLWYQKRPGGPLGHAAGETEWKASKPQRPWALECDARSLNIIYGMLKGNQYREIEKTYREHHGPNRESISKVLAHYGIDAVAFHEACGEIEYE